MWDWKNELLHGDRITTEFQRVKVSYIQIFVVLEIMIMRKWEKHRNVRIRGTVLAIKP
jgi:hypothetical protein